MTAQSIVCRSCAADVPGGRLSCPSCGELLASVAGSRRGATAAGARRVVPDVLFDVPVAPPHPVVEGQLALDGAAAHAGPSTRDPETELPWATAVLDGVAEDPDEGLHRHVGRNGSAGPGLHDVDAPEESLADPAAPETQGWQVGATSLQGGPTPTYMPRPDRRPSVPPGTPIGAPVAAHAGVAPGAYVPPVPTLPSVPAGAAAPARAWAGHAASTAAEAPVADAPSRRPSTGELDARARMLEFVRWLTVAGSAFAAMGFLLPWGLVVIGSADTTYFGRWGLAGPWHAVVALGVLTVLVLGLVQNGIPAWIRSGLPGVGLGALLIGLVWPYLALPTLGTGPGAIMTAVGGFALVVSGVLAIVADRPAERGASI